MTKSFDFDVFIQHGWDLLQLILLNPQSMKEFLLSLIVGVVILAIILSQAHNFGNSSRSSAVAGLFATVLSILLVLAGGSLTLMYVLPMISNQADDPNLVFGAMGIVFFAMVVPLTRAIFRAGYMTSLGSWIVAVAVAGVLVYGIHTYVQPGPGDRPPVCPSFSKPQVPDVPIPTTN